MRDYREASPSNLPSPSLSLCCSAALKGYKDTVRRHRFRLELLDDALSRLLFWLPHNFSGSAAAAVGDVGDGNVGDEYHHYGDAAWREVGYGILSLNRLSMHLALRDDGGENLNVNNDNAANNNDDNDRSNTYGASIRTKSSPTIAATSVRIALTAIHSVLPSFMSLAMLRASSRTRTSAADRNITIHNNNNSQAIIASAAARARLVVEQVKFLLRVYLLVSYWRQQQQQCTPAMTAFTTGNRRYKHRHTDDDDDEDQYTGRNNIDAAVTATVTAADCGIMMDGGMYRVDQSQEFLGMPWDRARAIQRRRNYVGERTGWNLEEKTNSNNKTKHSGDNGDDRDGNAKQHGGGTLYNRCCSGTFAAVRNPNRNNNNNNNSNNVRVVIADLLYALRPLLWAWFESRYHHHNGSFLSASTSTSASTPTNRNFSSMNQTNHHLHHRAAVRNITFVSYLKKIVLNNGNGNADGKGKKLLRGWILCLVIDVLSIRLLEGNSRGNNRNGKSRHGRNRRHWSAYVDVNTNPHTQEEIQRRKLRLFLYALRLPVWSGATLPALEGVSQTLLRKIPLLGGLAETVLWDWILYYQHPFVSEEG